MTTTINPPEAWVGYGINPEGGFLIKICSYCEDKSVALREAATVTLPVKFVICSKCFNRQLNARMGEKLS